MEPTKRRKWNNVKIFGGVAIWLAVMVYFLVIGDAWSFTLWVFAFPLGNAVGLAVMDTLYIDGKRKTVLGGK